LQGRDDEEEGGDHDNSPSTINCANALTAANCSDVNRMLPRWQMTRNLFTMSFALGSGGEVVRAAIVSSARIAVL
jgi:hypothetical protein